MEDVQVHGVERVQGLLKAEGLFVQTQEGAVAVPLERLGVFVHQPLGQRPHGIQAGDDVLPDRFDIHPPVPQVAADVDGEAG